MTPAELVEATVEELWPQFAESLSKFCDTGTAADAKEVLVMGTKINRLKWIQGQLDAEHN